MFTTLLDLVDGGARAGAVVRFPELGVTFTVPELLGRAARVAGALREVAAPGQPVVIAVGNSPELLVAFVGASWAGLVPAILPAANPFQDPERWLLQTAGTAKKARFAPIVVPGFAVQSVRSHPAAAGLVVLAVESLTDHAPNEAWSPHAEDAAFLQFTSGSLAAPKGVVISHRAVTANAVSAAERFGFQRGEQGVYWTPLCHDMALASCLTLLCAGCDQAILSTEGFARDPTIWLSHCVSSAATAAPPFAFARAMTRARSSPDLSSLRVAAVGAEPIDARLLRAFLAWSGKERLFVPNYGLAETVCGVLTGRVDDGLVTVFVRGELAPGRPVVVVEGGDGALELVGHGPPLGGHAVRVVVDGFEAPENVVGHVQLSGPSNSSGYLDDPEATALLFEGAWVRTGDIGFLRHGRLYLVGREKDVIIARGRHVFPEEIEAAAGDVPGVRPMGVCAFGEPDPAGGAETITVLFAAEDPAQVDALARTIAATVADRLGVAVDFLVPIERSALPRTTSGKLRRGAARAAWGRRR